MTLIGEQDLFLFNEGTHCRLYDCLGAHPAVVDGKAGTHFAVWAPNAERVSVIGDFCDWDEGRHPLKAVGSSGIWHRFVPGVSAGALYKFRIHSATGGYQVDKSDPFGFFHQVPPETASVVTDLSYTWADAEWMARRKAANTDGAPISVYELHLGSWRKNADGGVSYQELATELADHVAKLGFTHVELLPITEHPFGGSWGYQVTGYFAPTSRFGSPQHLMALIDALHARGIGVLLDWVPAHFPTDEHGLGFFDGTHLFEHADKRRGFHPDWNTLIFNYGRHEVRSFLLSSACFWLDHYHIDGLRVDGVASMLYLDYSRKEGEWIANEHGGRENLEAIHFLRQLNESVYRDFPDIQMVAEESTAWPMVSRPTYLGGLGFGFKWDMGWMHDTLEYFKKDPIHRKYHQDMLTFRAMYAFNENFVLPLSHDEVVHGKGSLLDRMPGDGWQKFANLRALYAYMFTLPGKKLLFMGCELAQPGEWNHDGTVDWSLADYPLHKGIQDLVSELNRMYRAHPALHQLDADPAGFRWLHTEDRENSVLAYERVGSDGTGAVMVVLNLTPTPHENYRIGTDRVGAWTRILNTDDQGFGGSDFPVAETASPSPVRWHDRPLSIRIQLPPLSATVWLHDEVD